MTAQNHRLRRVAAGLAIALTATLAACAPEPVPAFTPPVVPELAPPVVNDEQAAAIFDAVEKPALVTYFFSPSMVREAIRLGVAAAKGEEYAGQKIEGQIFLIPTIEIDKESKAEYEKSQDYIDRYSIAD